jgi:hypothetical protein
MTYLSHGRMGRSNGTNTDKMNPTMFFKKW